MGWDREKGEFSFIPPKFQVNYEAVSSFFRRQLSLWVWRLGKNSVARDRLKGHPCRNRYYCGAPEAGPPRKWMRVERGPRINQKEPNS